MTEISLSICLQHHPARAHLLPPLLARLDGFELVTDPEPDGVPNTLRTYRECLRRTPEWATHRLILQDDAWPCENFREKAETAVAEKPEAVICFFVPGAANHRNGIVRAAKAGEHWARVRTGAWVPTVATCFPAEIAARLLEFFSQGRMLKERGDDGPLARFCARSRIVPWATVPSLVEHPDVVPSLIGRRASAGANPARVAAIWSE